MTPTSLNSYFHSCPEKNRILFREFIWILEKAHGFSSVDLISGQQLLDSNSIQLLKSWREKRKEAYPLQYFMNSSEFCGMDFYIEEGALIPRMETEEIALWALENLDLSQCHKVLDIGTGSGCLGISVACKIPSLKELHLIEPYAEARKSLSKNVERFCMGRPFQTRVFDQTFEEYGQGRAAKFLELQPEFDLILSNPPYIAEGDPLVDLSVYEHEPHEALFGGALGWEKEVEWVKISYSMLKQKGSLVFEFSHDQKSILQERLKDYQPQFFKDSFGKDRFFWIYKE